MICGESYSRTRSCFNNLWYKLMSGVEGAGYLFLVSTLIIVIYGVLFWMCERRSNADLDAGYRGALTGIWLGVVTMTTLGFGDVTPKTIPGKLLTCVCVIVGLLKLSLLTGTLISIVTDMESLSITDQQVAFLFCIP